MNIEEFLTLAAKEEASDLFIVAGLPLTMKVNGGCVASMKKK